MNDGTPLPNALPPFDQVAALNALGNRIHVLRDLAELFLQERENMVRGVQNALEARDASEVERAVHSLRGAVGYFRAGPLWDVTSRMHAAATAADLAAVHDMLPEFEGVVERLAAALQAFLRSTSPTNSA